MKLRMVQATLFRNILDSTEVEIQEDVTCLVGKNESGKTAFLHALHRLNPAIPNVRFSIADHYPAWLEKRDRQRGVELERVRPIKAVFSLEEEDKAQLQDRFGEGCLTSDELTMEREYSQKLIYTFSTDEEKALKHAIQGADLTAPALGQVKQTKTFQELADKAELIRNGQAGIEDGAEVAEEIERLLGDFLGDDRDFRKAMMEAIGSLAPKFFYYDVYSKLPGRVKIRELLNANEEDLSDDEHTALSLLRQAATDDEYLLNPDYERRKRELENVANAISLDVLKYWTQNPELRVVIDLSQENIRNAQGQTEAVLDELKIRMWDERHWLSLPFDERSTGFRWFFSFLAGFSRYEWTDEPLVILLDEPALGLHARAQKDFLRFIDERLAPKHQVIHTTHSPFMVQPNKLERVRIVEERGRDEGSRISSDVLSTDPDTLFPLQGALGYDLVQHLFIAPHNLVVEGTSDYTYLSVLSDWIADNDDRTPLDDRWSIVPVGGANLIPTFVALLGHHLDVTVLIDARKGAKERLSNLADKGYLSYKRIVTVGEVLGRKLSDIEDVFTVDDYLLLYNRAFGKSINSSDLTGTDPIVSRIARFEGVERFNHGRPADVLLRRRDEILPILSQDTLDRFEKLFVRLNSTLPDDEEEHEQ